MEGINNISFNQDYTCISISTIKFHRIFNCDPFGEFYTSEQAADHTVKRVSVSGDVQTEAQGKQEEDDGDNIPTLMLKMLFSTSLTIIVPQNRNNVNRLLKIYNIKQKMKICDLTFPSNVIDVKLNRKRLCVILEGGHIYIYDLSCVRLMKVLEVNGLAKHETDGILDGQKEFVGDLTADDSSLIAIPVSLLSENTDLFNTDSGNVGISRSEASQTTMGASDENTLNDLIQNPEEDVHERIHSLTDLHKQGAGWIMVYDTINLKPLLFYKAHDSAVAKLAFSSDATMIASASIKGTIIKVCHFHKEGEHGRLRISKVTNLRRGHNTAHINCLSFCTRGDILGCASENKTIHLFKTNDVVGQEDQYTPQSDNSDIEDEDGSSEDLNENLANLLISKPSNSSGNAPSGKAKPNRLSRLRKKVEGTSRFINNQYTQSLVRNLPYKNYLNNLIWEPPRRCFSYILLPDSHPSHILPLAGPRNRVQIGFSLTASSSPIVLVASYQSGKFYQYAIPRLSITSSVATERQECRLMGQYSLI